MKKLFFTLFLILIWTKFSFSESLLDSAASGSSLFSDLKALKIGDLITIIISESSTASQEAKTATNKKTKSTNSAGTQLLDFWKGFGFSTQEDFSGGGSNTRKGSLTARVTARVIDILPNGNLKIEGTQLLMINNEKQTITISGIVRTEDVSAQNTVYSYYISDAQIKYGGKGPLGRKQKQGILNRLTDWLF